MEKLLHHEVLYRKRRRRGRWKSCWYTGFHDICARATVAKPQWRNGEMGVWLKTGTARAAPIYESSYARPQETRSDHGIALLIFLDDSAADR